MMQESKAQNRLITIISVVLPLAVAGLFGIKIPGYDFSFLPPIYAAMNGVTAICLVLAIIAVKNNKLKRHEAFMKLAIGSSALFLLMYVAYHITSESTHFGGEGIIKYVYYFILVTHIVLSVVVIPFVLFTFSRALNKNFEKHKKLARIAFPLWLYVAISGVLVYVMISPYYI